MKLMTAPRALFTTTLCTLTPSIAFATEACPEGTAPMQQDAIMALVICTMIGAFVIAPAVIMRSKLPKQTGTIVMFGAIFFDLGCTGIGVALYLYFSGQCGPLAG